MKHYSILMAILGLTFLAACSSSQTSEGELGDDIAAVDAGTDAVPQPSAENPDPFAQVTDPGTNPNIPLTDPAVAPLPDTSLAQVTPPPAVPEPAPISPPPAPEPTTVAASTPDAGSATGGTGSYEIRSGDTLMKIAFEQYGDLYKWKQIYEANKDKISDPNRITPGTVLVLEGASGGGTVERNGERYQVKTGDTLGRISADVYGTSSKWKKIWQNNRAMIKDPNKIFAGFYLYYTFGDKDREELERYRQEQPSQPAPIAQAPEAPADAGAPVDMNRGPASVSGTQ